MTKRLLIENSGLWFEIDSIPRQIREGVDKTGLMILKRCSGLRFGRSERQWPQIQLGDAVCGSTLPGVYRALMVHSCRWTGRMRYGPNSPWERPHTTAIYFGTLTA